jgi:hypothetical protein
MARVNSSPPLPGAINVLCASFETIQRTEAGRLLEIRMTFIESGLMAVPVSLIDFQSALVNAVTSGVSIALNQFSTDAQRTYLLGSSC